MPPFFFIFYLEMNALAQVARRITLQRLMPDAASVFSQAFKTLEIQEPCFTDLVILYRKSKQVLDRPSSEKDPLPKYSKVQYLTEIASLAPSTGSSFAYHDV